MEKWEKGAVILACDELHEKIRGKTVALMMNNAALDNEGRPLIDVIVEERWADVKFFFGMEHGVRGELQAGNSDKGGKDIKTGITIVDLYQYPDRIPPVEFIEQVDAVVYCTQDAGIRHWTFTPWLMELINSSAKAKREVIILDRPNPIRGDIVEGLCAEKYILQKLMSGFEYPLRHGMTIGELALMYNDIKNIGAELTVLKMKGWKRDMWYEDTGLLWQPISPNIPTVESLLHFGTTGLLQSSNISIGIATTTPFQYIGEESFDGEELARELNSRNIPGVFFLPKYYMARTGHWLADQRGVSREIKLCNGVLPVIKDRDVYRSVDTQLHIIDALIKLYPDYINLESNTSHGRVRMQTDEVVNAAKEKKSVLPLIDKWRNSANEFMKQRERYLLY